MLPFVVKHHLKDDTEISYELKGCTVVRILMGLMLERKVLG